METSLNVNWIDGMAFETNVNGHKLVIDAGGAVGGKDRGPRPKPLMLLALAGCTGMDVISILKKMRVELDDFSVEVVANNTDEHPKHYDRMKVIYKFWGTDLPEDKIHKAVNLSEERYCGVSFVYRKYVKMSTEVQLNPEK
ncbi:MAG: OsmC family protein [Bacteroidales bacterium]|jgi:putative redox protein|nr:OsmC family protein [Bacteroidales bacterium]